MVEKIKRLSNSELVKRAKNVKILAMDVDGVLTAGEIILLASGEEVKFWNAKDRLGFAVARAHKVPLVFAWLTGRKSATVEASAEDLGIHHVVQKCEDKKRAFESILKERGFKLEEAAFIGDDLIDLGLLTSVGFSAAPADAVRDVRSRVHYLSSFEGGKGVARDVLEFILRAQNKWDRVVSSYLC